MPAGQEVKNSVKDPVANWGFLLKGIKGTLTSPWISCKMRGFARRALHPITSTMYLSEGKVLKQPAVNMKQHMKSLVLAVLDCLNSTIDSL